MKIKRINSIKKTDLSIIDNQSGEIIGEVLVKTEKKIYYDNSKFIKVYKEAGISSISKKLNLLSNRLLFYIIDNIKYNTNEIELDLDKLVIYYELRSKKQLYKSIKELIKYEILYPINKKKYRINIELFYNGRKEFKT